MASRTVASLTAASTLTGTEVFYADSGSADVKVTADVVKDFITGRDRLTAAKTYYVSTTGNDDNDGSASSPWATIQHALEYVYYELDAQSYRVTIQLSDGTHAGADIYGPWQNSWYGPYIHGNASSPQNVIIEEGPNLSECFFVDENAALTIGNVTLQTDLVTGSHCLYAFGGSHISIEEGTTVRFGNCGGSHLRATAQGRIEGSGSRTVFGSADAHIRGNMGAYFDLESTTTTLTGTPDFNVAFIQLHTNCICNAQFGGVSITGSATGKRFELFNCSRIRCASDLNTFFPGNANGTIDDERISVASSAVTIASGAITASRSYHVVDTESSGATDDLDTINGGGDGMRLVLRAANSSRTVVVKDGTGNIQCAGDFSLDNVQDTIELIYDGTLTAWLEVGRSDNGA